MKRPMFFVGLHQPSDASHFDRVMLSVNRLETRKADISVNDWILDSGAFTRLFMGKGHLPVEEYASMIDRWSSCGRLLAAVAQDYMCEPVVLERTGLTVKDHQRLTIVRYLELLSQCSRSYIMPVLQGFQPSEYVAHVESYGTDLAPGAWVGVGSVCKRNGNVFETEEVLTAIKAVRPDLRLHGFGLKYTSLKSEVVNECLYSCDSMAWSYHARINGRSGNNWKEAERYRNKIATIPVQLRLSTQMLPLELRG